MNLALPVLLIEATFCSTPVKFCLKIQPIFVVSSTVKYSHYQPVIAPMSSTKDVAPNTHQPKGSLMTSQERNDKPYLIGLSELGEPNRPPLFGS